MKMHCIIPIIIGTVFVCTNIYSGGLSRQVSIQHKQTSILSIGVLAGFTVVVEMPSDKIDENILYILCYCYTVSDSIICNKIMCYVLCTDCYSIPYAYKF